MSGSERDSRDSGHTPERERIVRAVRSDEPGGAHHVWVECPYQLVVAGITRGLEATAGLRYLQRPVEAEIPHVIVLWVDNADELSESVERAQEANPRAVIMVLGLREDLALAAAALRAGARGFVHAGMSPEQVARAISVAMEGKLVAPRTIVEYLLDRVTQEEPAELAALSPRQKEILQLVAEGLSNRRVAERLYLTESTVKQHLRAAYKILGVSDRTEASQLVRRAARDDQATPPPPGHLAADPSSPLASLGGEAQGRTTGQGA